MAEAELACRIVLRKCVMIIVKSLTAGKYAHKQALHGSDSTVVWAVAVEMRGAVDEPCCVQGKDIAEDGSVEVGMRVAFAPDIGRDNCWHYKAGKQGQWNIKSLL